MCRKLNLVTIEEYIEENGGLLSFLRGLDELARKNGFNWEHELSRMLSDVEYRAKSIYRIL